MKKQPKQLKKQADTQRRNLSMLRRTLFLMVCGALSFALLIGTLFQYMIVDHEKYQEMAINNQTRTTTVSADRGQIYDCNYNLLAGSTSVENVFIDPLAIDNAAEKNPGNLNLLATGLASILDVDAGTILELAQDTQSRYKTVAKKVDTNTTQLVRDFINDNDIIGVYLEPDSQRYYPNESLASQVLGFTSNDNVGAEGLEAYYDETLQGTGGKIITTKGDRGTEMLYTYEKYYDATDGSDLVLSMDSTVQYYLEENLKTAIEKYDVLNGAFGAIMDVNTGAILASATLGGYDPNNYVEIYDADVAQQLEEQYLDALLLDSDSQEFDDAIAAYNAAVATARLRQWRNRTVSDGYEPGSTFKVITTAMALEEKAISLDSTYYCDGTEDFAGREQTIHCWQAAGHGMQTTAEALGNSCNVAFGHIGMALGGDNMYDYAKAFGLLEKTGVDMPGEGSGYYFSENQLKKPEIYGTSYLISGSFGQTFRITPMQLLSAWSAVVNGGYLMEPYIVEQVLDEEGNVISQHQPVVKRQVISEETSATMRELVEYVVTDGTATNAQTPGYRVGGKTGTSEKIDVLDEFGNPVEDKIVSFVGVAPMEDPQYIVLVALDTPSTATGYYISGGIMAAPTVRDVFADILPYLGVEPNYANTDPTAIDVPVPDLRGMTQAEANTALEALELTFRLEGEGSTITDQIPAPGSKVPGQSKIILYADKEKPTNLVEVPDFHGQGVVTANDSAAYLGLYLQGKGTDKSGATVTVTYQDHEPGEMVPLGTMITVEFTDHSAQD